MSTDNVIPIAGVKDETQNLSDQFWDALAALDGACIEVSTATDALRY
jgi:hypothetical protein